MICRVHVLELRVHVCERLQGNVLVARAPQIEEIKPAGVFHFLTGEDKSVLSDAI